MPKLLVHARQRLPSQRIARGMAVGSMLGLAVSQRASALPARGPLRVDPQNRRYLTDGSGKVVFLTGSHTWQTLKDRGLSDPPPPFDFTRYLDFLEAHHHNYFRLWTWEQPYSWNNNTDHLKRHFAPFPWQRTGPGNASDGKPKFDLTQFDASYFERVRSRTLAAGARGIYVAVTLFDGWDLGQAWNPDDGGLPYSGGNNVNGLSNGAGESQTLTHGALVTQFQDAYVKKVIDTVNDLDNVLYEISNETGTGADGVAWEYHMIDLVKQYEAGKPKQHPVGMSGLFPGSDEDLLRSNADWISPISQFSPSDGRKVIINDSDHSFYWVSLKEQGLVAQKEWVWKTFMTGASAAFMDPYLEPWEGRNNPSGSNVDPYWETIRNAMGYTRTYADRLDLERVVPRAELSTSGYCLADPGKQYLVYQPAASPFDVNLAAGSYRYEWFNATTGAVVDSGQLTAPSGARRFAPPFAADSVLFLTTESVPVPAAQRLGVGSLFVMLGGIGVATLGKRRRRKWQL